jgi:hypothetical protein
MENCLTLMTRERVVVETMLTIGIVTANPEASQARWKALQEGGFVSVWVSWVLVLQA